MSTSSRSRDSSSIQWQSSSTRTIGAGAASARRSWARRSSSDVLRSLASKVAVSSVSGISSPTTPPRSGRRATSPGSIAPTRARRAATWVSASPSSSTPSSRRQTSRHTKYALLAPNDWHSPIATRRPRRRTSRTNSATRRDLPMPASAAIPTAWPVPEDARASASSRAASSSIRPASGSSNRRRRREARSSDPVRAWATMGEALPLTVRSPIGCQVNASPAAVLTVSAT
jgi:hypothetical protein